MNTEICLIFRHSLLPRTADLIHPHLKSHACNIEGPTDFRASSQKIRLSGPPKERGMTDGMAIGWPTKSRTRSQIFLHIHRAKEIRIEGEGQRGRKTRAFILMDDGAKVYMKEIQYTVYWRLC